jgi:hypothetical protein
VWPYNCKHDLHHSAQGPRSLFNSIRAVDYLTLLCARCPYISRSSWSLEFVPVPVSNSQMTSSYRPGRKKFGRTRTVPYKHPIVSSPSERTEQGKRDPIVLPFHRVLPNGPSTTLGLCGIWALWFCWCFQ